MSLIVLKVTTPYIDIDNENDSGSYDNDANDERNVDDVDSKYLF